MAQQAFHGLSFSEAILWGRFMPWERDRAMRMLRVLADIGTRRLKDVERGLENGNAVVNNLPNWQQSLNALPTLGSRVYYGPYELGLFPLYATTYLVPENVGRDGEMVVESLVAFEAQRRATLLTLALQAYRLEHGQLPESIEAIEGEFFDELPRDPYSGRDFVYFPDGPPEPAVPTRSCCGRTSSSITRCPAANHACGRLECDSKPESGTVIPRYPGKTRRTTPPIPKPRTSTTSTGRAAPGGRSRCSDSAPGTWACGIRYRRRGPSGNRRAGRVGRFLPAGQVRPLLQSAVAQGPPRLLMGSSVAFLSIGPVSV